MSFQSTWAGRAAVITGAGSGIGAALATHAAREGMRVMLVDINSTSVSTLASTLRQEGADALARVIDVGDAAAMEELAREAFALWGHVDLLINNAGIETHGRLWELPIKKWNAIVDVNLNGVYYGMRFFIPHMLNSGRRAAIVNVASVAALSTRAYTSGYGATKHACLVLSEIAALELAAETQAVTVSVVLPGAVATDIFASAFAVVDDGLAERDRHTLEEDLAAAGISPAEAARIIFDGIRAGKLYIHTDTQLSRSRIDERAELLRRSLSPALEV